MKENLNIRFLSIPAPIAAGENVQFRAQVVNNGDDATPSQVDFDIDFEIDDEVIATKTVEKSIAAGEEFIVDAPSRWTAERGKHRLKVVVDPDNNLTEETRSDNTKERQFLVSSAPPEADELESRQQGQDEILHVVVMEVLSDIPGDIPNTIRAAAGQPEVAGPNVDNPKFIFPLWRSVDSEAGVELSDKSTRGGQSLGENRRQFPETFSVDVKVQSISPITQDEPGRILQDTELPRQIDALFEAEEQRVRMTSTKHGRTVTGILRRVRLQDSRDHQDAAIVSLDVREDPGAGGGPTLSLADLVVDMGSNDPSFDAGDAAAQTAYWARVGADPLDKFDKGEDIFAPKSPSKAGEKQCIRVTTQASSQFSRIGDAYDGSSLDSAVDESGEALNTAWDGIGSAAHAVGAFTADFGDDASDSFKQVNPSGQELRWVDLGPISGGLPGQGRITGPEERLLNENQRRLLEIKEKILERVKSTKYYIPTTSQPTFDGEKAREGEDYRVVDEGGGKRIEVSGRFLARLLPGKQPVRCD